METSGDSVSVCVCVVGSWSDSNLLKIKTLCLYITFIIYYPTQCFHIFLFYF